MLAHAGGQQKAFPRVRECFAFHSGLNPVGGKHMLDAVSLELQLISKGRAPAGRSARWSCCDRIATNKPFRCRRSCNGSRESWQCQVLNFLLAALT